MTDNSTLPAQASVVVIGGGVMGCSTLYHLAKAGITDAVLIERNQLTSGTTWHSAAQVRALRSSRNMTELIRYSVVLYAALEEETGQATGWINKGSLSIATSPDRMIHIERQAALARLYGVRAETVTAGAAKEIWPLMNAEDVLGAVWSPDDGRVSPSDLCAALIKGAKARGARVFEETAVTGITVEANRVKGLETSRGAIRTDAVALCTGLWSREAGAMAGADIPVYPCEHFYLLTKPVEGIEGNMPTLSDHDSHLYIRDDSGGLLVGCFEPMGKPIAPGVLGENFAFQLLPEDWDHFEPMMLNALHRLPPLETAEVKTLLNGPESFTPDGTFLLGRAAETDGLFLGCGMNSVGVATGGGAGMALAHCIAEGHMPMDLHEVDPARFPGCWNDAAALAQRAPEVLGKHYEITYPARQWSTARHLRQMPLDQAWREANAHFGQVFGWERPLYFGKTAEPKPGFEKPDWFAKVGEEVRAAHEGAAVFDQSTLGKIAITGPDAERFLDRLCTNDAAKPPGAVSFTLLLNEDGGIEEDATLLRLNDEHYRLSVGTGAVKRVMAHLRRGLEGSDRVSLRDVTEDFATLALAGPEARAIAAQFGAEDLITLPYFRHRALEIGGISVEAARLSYVGEAGWDLTCAAKDAPALLRKLKEAGAVPAGFFAQTAMRIEKRFLAYGHDMDTDTDPLVAGLGFALAWDTDFVGKDALKRRKADRETAIDRGGDGVKTVLSLLFDDADAVPLGHEPVLLDGAIVGQTHSAAFGYRVGRPVAIATLDRNAARAEKIEVDIAGRIHAAKPVTGAVFDPRGTRMRG
ncbi:GcvT family protein [Hwanghaeella sp.]|uniref:GcvT family protein n=1 Tax=Hwanghaeella sp. TaxID=2605943 RepID=UPI003CCC0CE6